jgi:hypothetical protein
MNNIQKHEDILFEHISNLIEQTRKNIVTTINTAEVYTKFDKHCLSN